VNPDWLDQLKINFCLRIFFKESSSNKKINFKKVKSSLKKVLPGLKGRGLTVVSIKFKFN
jgi:hypothetical protein